MRRAWCLGVAIALLACACSASSPPNAEPGPGEVALTLSRVIEEITPQPDSTITFDVSTSEGHVYSETFDVEFSGSDYRATLGTISVAVGEIVVAATIEPQGTRCETTVDLVQGVDVSVSVLVRHECFFEVIETEPWHTDDGETVAESELVEFHGPGHCGWQSVRFIAFGGYFEGDAYIRDPDGRFDETLFVSSEARARLGLDPHTQANAASLEPGDYLTLDLDSALPDDPEDLGYTRGLREIFISAADNGDYLYVVSPGGVERWPRVLPHPACA